MTDAGARRAYGMAMHSMISGLELYVDTCGEVWGPVADDGVLGNAVEAIGEALSELLNGELGHLDGGDCWSRIHRALKRAGFPRGLDK